MHVFHNRPLALACACVALTAVFAYRLAHAIFIPLCVLLSVVAVTFAVLYFIKRYKQLFLVAFCGLLCLSALLSSYCFFGVRSERHRALIGQTCEIEGTVVKIDSSKSYATVFRVKLERLEGEACTDSVLLKCDYASALQIGECFTATVTGTDFIKEGGYDEKSYVLSDGVIGVYTCERREECITLETRGTLPQILFYKWNSALSARLQAALGGEEGRLADALLLGNRRALSDETALNFQRAGVTHLLALSGLHVSILIGIFDFLLKRLYCPKMLRILVISLLSVLYLFLTGCAPSTVRAVSMLFFMNLGFVLRDEYDSFTALCLTLALFLLITPYSVADLGMWMSFVAAGAIIVFLPALSAALDRLYEAKKLPKPVIKLISIVATAFFIGIIANIALLLFQARSFGEYSILSVPTTLLLSLPMSATLLFSIAAIVAPPLGFLGKLSARCMLLITDGMRSMDGVLYPIDDVLSLLVILAATAALLFVAMARLRRVLLWCVLPLALSLAIFPTSILATGVFCDSLRVDCLTESGGDILLFSQNGACVAVDFSDGTGTGASLLADTVREARCTELTDLVISHYHNRGTYFIYRLSSLIYVRNLRLPMPKNAWEEAVAARMCEEAELLGINVSFGLEELAVSTLRIDALEHEPLLSGRHPALLLSAHGEDQSLIYINCSATDSVLAQKALDTLETADVVLIGGTGYSADSDTQIPSEKIRTEQIYITDGRLASAAILPSELLSIARIDDAPYFFYLN